MDNCGSIGSCRWAFDEIFAALRQNGYEKNYKKEISDLKDTYESFLSGKVEFRGQKMMRVKQKNRVVDTKLCLAKYEKLINGGYKSIGSWIYLKNKLRRGLLLTNWHRKGETHKKFLKNTDLIFEFGCGSQANLSYRNLDAFAGNNEILCQIQKAYGLLYNCYYKKED